MTNPCAFDTHKYRRFPLPNHGLRRECLFTPGKNQRRRIGNDTPRRHGVLLALPGNMAAMNTGLRIDLPALPDRGNKTRP